MTALVSGKEIGWSAGTFVGINTAREIAEVGCALKVLDAVGCCHLENGRMAESEEPQVMGFEIRAISSSRYRFDDAPEPAVVAVDITDPPAVPGSFKSLGRQLFGLAPFLVIG